MDEGLVTEVLVATPEAPSFALPVLRFSEQSNSRYLQVLDLTGRVDSLEPCHPRLENCINAPPPFHLVRVGEAPIHAVIAPDGSPMVGRQDELAPIIRGWLEAIEHPLTRFAFAHFAGEIDTARTSAAAALSELGGSAGHRVAERWYLRAIILPEVTRELLRRGAGAADVDQLERLVGQVDIQKFGQRLWVTMPEELQQQLNLSPNEDGDLLRDGMYLAGPLGVKSISWEVRSPARRRAPAAALEGANTQVVIIGRKDVHEALLAQPTAARRPSDGDPAQWRTHPANVEVEFLSSQDLVEPRLAALLSAKLPAVRNLLIAYDTSGEDTVPIREIAGTLKRRARSGDPWGQINVVVSPIFAGVDQRDRKVEASLALSGEFDDVLSLANAWTPLSYADSPGSASRLAACISGWAAAAVAGLFEMPGNEAARGPRILSAMSVSAKRGLGEEAALAGLLNPLWPEATESDVYHGTGGGPRTAVWHRAFERQPSSSRVNTTPKRRTPYHFALSLTEPTSQVAWADLERFVAAVLRHLGWTVNERPDRERGVDLFVTHPDGSGLVLEVKSDRRAAEDSRSRRGLADYLVLAETWSRSLGGLAHVVTLDRLGELAHLAVGRSRDESRLLKDRLASLPYMRDLAQSGARIDPRAVVPEDLGASWLGRGDPRMRDVLRPLLSGRDVARFPEGRWALDFGALADGEPATVEEPLRYFLERSELAGRDDVRVLPKLPKRIRSLTDKSEIFLLTASVSKHRIFLRCRGRVAPTQSLVVCREPRPWLLALLSSRLHRVWSEGFGQYRGDVSRYTVKSVETFPVPAELRMDAGLSRSGEALAQLGEQLMAERMRWQYEELRHPEAVLEADFLVDLSLRSRDFRMGQRRKVRTLTALYNEGPDWLASLNNEIDRVVFDAYGLSHLADPNEIIEQLMSMRQRDVPS